MSYQQTLELLYASLPVFQRDGAPAYKPGLENTAAMSSLMGDAHRRFEAIHVAGTNGKGSTSHILAAIMQSDRRRTGLFTSPHLKDFRERVRLDGRTITEAEVVEFTEKWFSRMTARGMTFFEMCTLLAFDRFAAGGAQIAVIETGLGGRLDATNIITPRVSVITNIGLDHTAQLGGTPREIAREKAGIIKPGVPVVVGQRDETTDRVFQAAADAAGAPILWAQDLYRVAEVEPTAGGQRFGIEGPDGRFSLDLDLAGEYQRHNIVTALAVCRALGDVPREAIRRGCAAVRPLTGLRGRWETIAENPLIVCDTAHNAHGLRETMAQLRAAAGRHDEVYIVLGVVADKDLAAILPLLPLRARYIFTAPSTPRALPPEKLAAAAAGHGLRGTTAPTVAAALAAARRMASPGDMILVTGSNFTVANAM